MHTLVHHKEIFQGYLLAAPQGIIFSGFRELCLKNEYKIFSCYNFELVIVALSQIGSFSVFSLEEFPFFFIKNFI